MKSHLKMTLYIVAAAGLVCLCTTLLQAQSDNIEIKLGYIDLSEVFETYHKSLPEYKVLEKEWDEKKAEIEQLKQQLEDIEEEVKNEDFLSDERRKQLSGKHAGLKVDYEATTRKAKAAIAAKEESFLEKVYEQINDAVREIGVREGYTMIFRKSDLIYGSQSVELTRDTLTQLETNRKKASTSG